MGMGLACCSPHGVMQGKPRWGRKVVGDIWKNMRIMGQGLEACSKLESSKGWI